MTESRWPLLVSVSAARPLGGAAWPVRIVASPPGVDSPTRPVYIVDPRTAGTVQTEGRAAIPIQISSASSSIAGGAPQAVVISDWGELFSSLGTLEAGFITGPGMLFQNTTLTTLVSAVGQNAQGWRDISGKGRHATNATATRIPLAGSAVGGYFAPVFDTTDVLSFSMTGTPLSAGNRTVFLVVTVPATPTGVGIMLSSGGNLYFIGRTAGAGNQPQRETYTDGSAAVQNINGQPLVLGRPSIISVVDALVGTTYSIAQAVNGAGASTSQSGGYAPVTTTTWFLGNNTAASSNGMQGTLSAAMLYRGTMAPAQRRLIEYLLSVYFGIPGPVL